MKIYACISVYTKVIIFLINWFMNPLYTVQSSLQKIMFTVLHFINMFVVWTLYPQQRSTQDQWNSPHLPCPAPTLHPPCTRPAHVLHHPCTCPTSALHPPWPEPWSQPRPHPHNNFWDSADTNPTPTHTCLAPALDLQAFTHKPEKVQCIFSIHFSQLKDLKQKYDT